MAVANTQNWQFGGGGVGLPNAIEEERFQR